MKKVVIALGGNALQARGEAATSENQLRNVMATAEHIARIIGEGYEVIISHGNGPQVGRLMLQNEAGKSVTPPMPMVPFKSSFFSSSAKFSVFSFFISCIRTPQIKATVIPMTAKSRSPIFFLFSILITFRCIHLLPQNASAGMQMVSVLLFP